MIRFWSLRNGLGSNLGVIFDIDTEVTRMAMRVRTNDSWFADGWKWQIHHLPSVAEWDETALTDQECLNQGNDGIEILNLGGGK